MNLDRLQVNACIRSGWQALDLGLLMARAWWRSLILACLLPMLPLAIVLLVIFRHDPLWAWFAIWWLKPFWERLPLYMASRLLFGEMPGTWASLRSLSLKDVLPWLLWRRLSLQRAFDNPVTVLEELKGAPRRRRLRVLHGKYSDVAVSNQLIGFCCELLLAAGLVMTFDFFVPDSLGIEVYDSYDDLALAGEWIFTVAGLFAMVLVMPYHSMAGFALYLNRRIELEAWDIEISFRNLANRYRSTASSARQGLAALLPTLLLLAALCGGTLPADVQARVVDHDRESAAALIEEVLQGEDFGEERSVSKWRFKEFELDEETEEKVPEWLIDIVKWLEQHDDWWETLPAIAFWLKMLLVLLFGVLVIYLLRRFRGPLSRLARGAREEEAPEVLFGLDVTPQSLPEDVPAQVLGLWEAGAGREALSLLYRATLSRLIDRYQIAFRASHTEAECAALVRARGVDSLSEYFTELTQVWRRLAYGHRLPLGDTVQALCARWKRELTSEE